MEDYKLMYFKLFNAVSDAIHILQKAQQEAEEAYISNRGEDVIRLSDISGNEDK